MSTPRLPDPLARSNVLYGGQSSPALLSAYGQACEERGYAHDAMDFYEQAGDREGARRIAALARGEFNAFLLRRAIKTTKEILSREDLMELAKTAEKSGHFASSAAFYEDAGALEEVQRVRREAGLFLPTRESLGAEKAEPKPDSEGPEESQEEPRMDTDQHE